MRGLSLRNPKDFGLEFEKAEARKRPIQWTVVACAPPVLVLLPFGQLHIAIWGRRLAGRTTFRSATVR
jgi:hypothetical protein